MASCYPVFSDEAKHLQKSLEPSEQHPKIDPEPAVLQFQLI